jgi:hypothetical protein
VAPMVIKVPTLNDSRWDFEQLFSLWSQTNGYFEDIVLDFSGCHFLRPNAVAFLGGLARLIESRMGTVVFDWSTLRNGAVKMNLLQNGFAGVFGHPTPGWSGNSIPYREDGALEQDGIMDYLTLHWLGRGWVHVSPRLRDAIAGRMWEIYNNAFEHAGSQIGVFSCGQYFRHRNELVLSVVDFGQGIAANVRNFLSFDPRAEQLRAAGCLRWAFQRGTSTRPNGMARGVGLDLLKEFIRVNHGRLEVYSNEGYGLIDQTSELFENRSVLFEGTMFHITLRCDERYYQFADETP